MGKKKVVFEGIPEYNNRGNGGFSEWAYLSVNNEDSLDLLDMFKKTELNNYDDIFEWKYCKVRVTIEVLKVPTKGEIKNGL